MYHQKERHICLLLVIPLWQPILLPMLLFYEIIHGHTNITTKSENEAQRDTNWGFIDGANLYFQRMSLYCFSEKE